MSQQHLCPSVSTTLTFHASTAFVSFICLYNAYVPCVSATTFVFFICLERLCASCVYSTSFLHVSTTLAYIVSGSVCVFHMSLQCLCVPCVTAKFVFIFFTTLVCFLCFYDICLSYVSTTFVFSRVSTTFMCFICLTVRVYRMYVQHLCPSCVSTTFACYMFLQRSFETFFALTNVYDFRIDALKAHLGADVSFVRFVRKLGRFR